MKIPLKPIAELPSEEIKEVELMLSIDELRTFAAYCAKHNIKFNDWIRQLAHEALDKED